MRTPLNRRRAIRSHTKGQLAQAVTSSERDLAITIAWSRLRQRRAILVGMFVGTLTVAVVHALVCP